MLILYKFQVEIDTFSQVLQQCTSPMLESVKEYIATLSSGVGKPPFGKNTPEFRIFKTLTSSSVPEDDPLKVCKIVLCFCLRLLFMFFMSSYVHIYDLFMSSGLP